jgi:hypothetical protein
MTHATPIRHTSRSIRLLDRHWAWLDAQPAGAAASLRRLVEAASRDADGRYRRAAAREACYFLMRDAAGDRPHFEEAARALFADDRQRLRELVADWPEDVRLRIAELLDDAGAAP